MDFLNISFENIVKEALAPPVKPTPSSSSRKRQATHFEVEAWSQYTKRWQNQFPMETENSVEPLEQQFQNEWIQHTWSMSQQNPHEIPQQMHQYQNGWVDNPWNYQQQQKQQQVSQEGPIQHQQIYDQPQYNQLYKTPPQMDQAQVVQYDHQHQSQQPQSYYQQMPQQPTYQPYEYNQTPPDALLSNNSTPNLGNESVPTIGSNASICSTYMNKLKDGIIEKSPEEAKQHMRTSLVERQFVEWLSKKEKRRNNYNLPNFDMSKDNEVLETVGGRMAIVGNMTKYDLTAGELRRRIEGAECFNISQLNFLIRKAKKKNGSDEIRGKLWLRYGIEINYSQNNAILQSRFTPILEEEARTLATDVDRLTSAYFPRDALAKMVMESMKKCVNCPLKLQKLIKSFVNTLNRIIEIASQCHPKTAGDVGSIVGYKPLDEKMEFYSNRCHGFGNINMNTWFREIFHVFQIIQREADYDVAQGKNYSPMALNYS